MTQLLSYIFKPKNIEMRKQLNQDQNNGKALEVRLEQEGATYYVIIAGLTFNLKSGCVNGTCDSSGPDEDYLQVENETYDCKPYNDYRTAKEIYDSYKTRYID